MSSPRWEHVVTDAGHHLRLRGGNGEPIMTSEVYTDPQTVREAYYLAKRSFLTGFAYAEPRLVDERVSTGNGDTP